MKIYENDKFLIVDTERNTLLNPIYVFFKDSGYCNMLSKKEIEDNLCYPDVSAWEYQAAVLYFSQQKTASERSG